MIWKNIFTSPREETEQIDEENKAVDGHSSENKFNKEGRVMSAPKTEFPRDIQDEGRSRTVELNLHIVIHDESQVGRAALLLAATTTSDSENRMKKDLTSIGWKSVATEVGGLAGDLPQKITRALVGASLNAEVVEKTRNEMHALMHAALEALEGFLAVGMLEASVGAKIAIVRNSRWIAVAVMGDTAYHAVAHHERCGLGVMHI